MILCDDKLKELTGEETINSFGLMKYIKKHLLNSDK